MMTEQNQIPQTKATRSPPDRISLSCFIYMARAMELTRFAHFFYNVIDLSDGLSAALDEKSKLQFQETANLFKNPATGFSLHRQFINESMLSRSIESFNLYLILILNEIFRSNPEILKSKSAVEVETIIELKSFDAILSHIIEKRLHELSYKSLSDLAEFVADRTGIELFKSERQQDTVLLASELRNLTAHNDCRTNTKSLRL